MTPSEMAAILRAHASNEYMSARGRLVVDQAAEMLKRMEGVIGEAEIQITYLHEKFGETGSGNAVLAKLRAILGHGERQGEDQ